MHPKGLYEPELVKRWRERIRRFELSELVRSRKSSRKATSDKAPSVKSKERAKSLVDA